MRKRENKKLTMKMRVSHSLALSLGCMRPGIFRFGKAPLSFFYKND